MLITGNRCPERGRPRSLAELREHGYFSLISVPSVFKSRQDWQHPVVLSHSPGPRVAEDRCAPRMRDQHDLGHLREVPARCLMQCRPRDVTITTGAPRSGAQPDVEEPIHHLAQAEIGHLRIDIR